MGPLVCHAQLGFLHILGPLEVTSHRVPQFPHPDGSCARGEGVQDEARETNTVQILPHSGAVRRYTKCPSEDISTHKAHVANEGS